jgi:hypothetical protein
MTIETTHYEITYLGRRPAMSPNERWTQNGQFHAYCQYSCDWDDRNTLVYEIGAEDDGAGQLYPHYPDANARVYAVNVLGWGRTPTDDDNTVLCKPQNALVTVFYSTLAPFVRAPRQFIVERIEPRQALYPISHRGKTWGTTGTAVQQNEMPPWELSGCDYVLELHKLLAVPAGTYSLVGSTNAGPFASTTLGVVFPAQSLHYRCPAVQSRIQLAHLPSLTITYRFPVLIDPWTGLGAQNMHFNAAINQYDTIVDATYGTMVFKPTANFNLLLP